MSILIRNIDVPESCETCVCRTTEAFGGLGCRVTGYIIIETQSRPEWCPIVFLPVHGDLIDRSALPWERQGKMLTDPDKWGLEVQDIESAPIVIPAD